jgi:hypothetical protein
MYTHIYSTSMHKHIKVMFLATYIQYRIKSAVQKHKLQKCAWELWEEKCLSIRWQTYRLTESWNSACPGQKHRWISYPPRDRLFTPGTEFWEDAKRRPGIIFAEFKNCLAVYSFLVGQVDYSISSISPLPFASTWKTKVRSLKSVRAAAVACHRFYI